jgi:hypothetical protein
MNELTIVISESFRLLSLEFNIMGFSISFLNVIIWSTVASLVIWFINEVKR